jgi:hypothetical protein
MLILGAQLVLMHAFMYPCRKNGQPFLIRKRLSQILSDSGGQ